MVRKILTKCDYLHTSNFGCMKIVTFQMKIQKKLQVTDTELKYLVNSPGCEESYPHCFIDFSEQNPEHLFYFCSS